MSGIRFRLLEELSQEVDRPSRLIFGHSLSSVPIQRLLLFPADHPSRLLKKSELLS